MVVFTLAKKLFSNCCTLRFVEYCLAVMNRLVMRSSRDPNSGPNPASFEGTDTPSTSLSANASGAPGYPNFLARAWYGIEWKTIFPYSILAIFFLSFSIPC